MPLAVAGASALVLLAATSSAADGNGAAVSPAPGCAHPASCVDFALTFTNTGSAAIDGMTIQVASPNAITAFSLGGQPFKPTGVQGAHAAYPLSIAAGKAVTGTGETSAPLASGDLFTIFTTTDSFATATGQDVHFSLAAGTHAGGGTQVGSTLEELSMTSGPIYSPVTVNYRFVATASVYTYEEEEAQPTPQRRPRPRPRPLASEELSGTVEEPSSVVALSVDPPARSTGSCRWLVDTRATFRTRACNQPVWIPAVVHGRTWSFRITRPLPPGTYTIESRASHNGTLESVFDASRRNRVTVVIRPGHR